MSPIVLEEKKRATQDYIALEERYGAHNYHPLDVVVERGEGVWVWDVEGKPLPRLPLRLLGGQPGPLPPAHRRGADRAGQPVTLTSRAFRNDQLARFYARSFAELTGYRTGAADEHRRRGGRDRDQAGAQVGLPGQGHRPRARPRSSSAPTTSTAAPPPSSASPTETQYRDGFGPFTPGFRDRALSATPRRSRRPSRRTRCAFLVEPIQGEAGIIMPPAGYLAAAARICRGAQRAADGRRDPDRPRPHRQAVRLEHEGIRPDVVIVGKALCGGFYPVSAAWLADERSWTSSSPASTARTFGGNPLAGAVGRAALHVLVDEELSRELGRDGRVLPGAAGPIERRHVQARCAARAC